MRSRRVRSGPTSNPNILAILRSICALRCPTQPFEPYRLVACKRTRSLVGKIDRCCSRRSQEVIVLVRSMETVIGPTPPGTGVM